MIFSCMRRPSGDPCRDIIDDFFVQLQKELDPTIHTVILSSETLFNITAAQWRSFAQRASDLFDVTCIFYVREIYGWSFSHKSHGAKSGIHDACLALRGDGDRNKHSLESYFFKPMFESTAAFPDVRITNYDYHKKDLVTHFVTMVGLQPERVERPAPVNRSLTCSELNLVSAFSEVSQTHHLAASRDPVTGLLDESLGFYLMHTKPHKKAFRYYDHKVATRLYDNLRTHIRKINTYLPADELLPTEPHCPEGYVTTWDQEYVELEDVKTSFDYLAARIKKLTDTNKSLR